MKPTVQFITTQDGVVLARCLLTGLTASGSTESEAAAELRRLQTRKAAA